MIVGTCPYDGCDHPVWLAIPDDVPLPTLERHICEGCKGVIWTYISRIDPWSMTEADFLKKYDVDPDTKVVTAKKGA